MHSTHSFVLVAALPCVLSATLPRRAEGAPPPPPGDGSRPPPAGGKPPPPPGKASVTITSTLAPTTSPTSVPTLVTSTSVVTISSPTLSPTNPTSTPSTLLTPTVATTPTITSPTYVTPATTPNSTPATSSPVNASPSPVLRGIAYGGSGCPSDSAKKVQRSSDPNDVYFDAPGLNATLGSGTSARDWCQVNIDILYAKGWQYTVPGQNFTGYASLDSGVTGYASTLYYFSGYSSQTQDSATFTGPLNGEYQRSDKIVAAETQWSPCGVEGAINIKNSVSVSSSSAGKKGYLTSSSDVDAKKFIDSLIWRQC